MKYWWIFLLSLPGVCHAKLVPPKNPGVLVYNITKDRIEYSLNIDEVRPIASITKVMTAMVTINYDQDFGRSMMLSNKVGSNLPRQLYTRHELLNAMLVRSDNAAAETLAQDYPGGRDAFIKQMNQLAMLMGLYNTHFDDPTGLSQKNTSVITEVATMLTTASEYKFIQDTSTKLHAEFETIQPKKKIKTISLNNTNGTLLSRWTNILLSKTGLTTPAGWCVGVIVSQNKQQYVIVVLGAKSKANRLEIVEKAIQEHILLKGDLE